MKEVLITTFTSAITAMIGWLIGRRRSTAETLNIEINNIGKVVKLWQDLANELRKDMEKLMQENAEMKREIRSLELKVITLTRENKKLRELIEKNGLTQ